MQGDKNTHKHLPSLPSPLSSPEIRAEDCAQLLTNIPDKNQAISQSVAFFHPLIHKPHIVIDEPHCDENKLLRADLNSKCRQHWL